jgi:hypothetical protein
MRSKRRRRLRQRRSQRRARQRAWDDILAPLSKFTEADWESVAESLEIPEPEVAFRISSDTRALLTELGADAAFWSPDGQTLYLVAREHDSIDWDRVLDFERLLQASYTPGVSVSVRAHQGRDPVTMFPGRNPCDTVEYWRDLPDGQVGVDGDP